MESILCVSIRLMIRTTKRSRYFFQFSDESEAHLRHFSEVAEIVNKMAGAQGLVP